MDKITVAQLLTQYGLTWYGLHRRGAGSKSMCRDWATGKHLPSTKSAARIARAIGLPLAFVLDTIQTRNPWENSPRVTWGTHVRKELEARLNAEITDRFEANGTWCLTCRQRMPKAA